MDHYFKSKKTTSKNDDPIIIDESIFLTENSNMEQSNSNMSNNNDDDSLIIIEENKSNPSLNKAANNKVKSDLKQLLSGRSHTETPSNKRSLAISDKNQKGIFKRSKTSVPAVTKKSVDIFEMSDTKSSHGKNVVRNILDGNSTKEELRSANSFFNQHKLNRFHPWSAKKNIENPYFPERLYVNGISENKSKGRKEIEDFYSKQEIEHNIIDYNTHGFIDEFMHESESTTSAETTKFIEVPGNSQKANEVDNTELWTDFFKPSSYDELQYLIPQETLQTLKYQLEVSLNFLKTRPDHERQLLSTNWKSIMKKRKILNDNENYDDLDTYDNDFIVDDDLIDEYGNEIPLDHIPLFIFYGNGIGKNTTLQLVLKELEKSGHNVNNILEVNASMNRGKKDIFNTCFEACTSKFLSKEDGSDNDHSRKSHLSGGVILFDEVDILFRSDVLFYPMIIKLLQVTKKPIVLTCTSLEGLPEQFIKITDYQKTNFMFNMPDSSIPYLNYKLGLKLKTEKLDRYKNINRDIRHSLLQLQLDRRVEIDTKTGFVDEESFYNGLKSEFKNINDFADNIDLMSFSDVLECGTKYKSQITKSCDYSVLDFIENKIYNDTSNLTKSDLKSPDNSTVDDYDDLLKKEAKLRMNGTISLQNVHNVNKLLSNKRNYYEETTWNTLEDYELNIGQELIDIATTSDSYLKNILKTPPNLSATNKSKLARNLFLKLEYMQNNSLPQKSRLQPTRTTINEFLVNLESSKDVSLPKISFSDMIDKNYVLTDNRLNYEFTKADDLFCYHYPYFRSLFAVDIANRQVIQTMLDEMQKEENIDNIQGLKHLIKEKRIKQLLFDQDPRIYWEQ